MATLYENIRTRRIELKMSQEQLAKLTGYSDRTSISKIEAGKVDLSQSKIKLFASALQTTPSQLMGCSSEQDYNEFQEEISSPLVRIEENFLMLKRLIESADDRNAAGILHMLKDILSRCTEIEDSMEDQNHKLLLSFYDNLNAEGKERLFEYIYELLEIPRYQKSQSPLSDTDQTSEDQESPAGED